MCFGPNPWALPANKDRTTVHARNVTMVVLRIFLLAYFLLQARVVRGTTGGRAGGGTLSTPKYPVIVIPGAHFVLTLTLKRWLV